MDQGWIKLHRKSFKSQAWTNAELWHLWCYCLLKANRAEAWVPIKTGRGSTEVHVLPGQFIFGSRRAATDLKQKLASVHRRLKKLETMRNVILEVKQHFTIVTICNWDTYQGLIGEGGTEDETPTEHQRNTNGTPTEPNNKEEKDNKEEKEKKEEPFLLEAPDVKALEVIEIPRELDTAAFRASWDEWIDYRRQASYPKWKPVTICKRLKDMAQWGQARAIAAIDFSIGNGYQGLIEPTGGRHRTKTTPEDAERFEKYGRKTIDG